MRRQAFLLDHHGQLRLPAVPSGGSTVAVAMNDAGAILLNCTGGGFEIRSQAWLWRDGRSTLVNGLPGGGVWGEALTPGGRITGRLRTPGGNSHAFLHEDGCTHDLNCDLGYQSEALAANDHRVVVGRMIDPAGERHAFRWTPADGMRPLDEFVADLTTTWTFQKAVAVNAAGVIAGRGLWRGEPRGFLLRPAI